MKRKPKTEVRRSAQPLRIVAIGGSAGSLEALEAMFARLPSASGAAFVVVTHRDPRAKELMPDILASVSAMPVRMAKQGEKLAADTTYVVPSGAHVSIHRGRFELKESGEQRGRSRSAIDALFCAIADDAGERATGIVLSGMGSDGTIGLAAIAARGGIGMAQDPASAAYDSMPRSAIEKGSVKLIGTPDELADAVIGVLAPRDATESPPSTDVDAVLAVLSKRTGHDFASYKRSTVVRRLQRRMGMVQARTVAEYRVLLERDADEAKHLFDDLLIGVTTFFRDPRMFEALSKGVRQLLVHHPANRPVRGWIAGCATGEEAYSLAILLREQVDARRRGGALQIQIYATDIDEDAIERARRGFYGRSIEEHVSPERLARFFTVDGDGYRIRKEIRDTVVFATHNLIRDPPFTRIDLLSCRNVLIYLQPDLQRRVLDLFRYSVDAGGLLVLGGAESVTALADSFVPVDARWKIFRRSGTRTTEHVRANEKRATPIERTTAKPRSDALPLGIERAIVEHIAPPVAVVGARHELLSASGRIDPFLRFPGRATRADVVALAREGLAIPLRLALRRAAKTGKPVEQSDIPFERGTVSSVAGLIVVPVRDDALGTVFLVAFDERREERRSKVAKKKTKSSTRTSEVVRLRRQLRAMLADVEQSQQELHSTNEELQSANEELQSSNEELTTSKEEMQSMNEELLTLNAELHAKNEALTTTNDDMRNLLNASQIPTLFLDGKLRLRRFTAHATRIANLIPGDVGRPITDISLNIEYPHFARDIKEVLDTLVFKEVAVSGGGALYSMRIYPYRTTNDVIDGVVVTFLDVTALRRIARDAEERTLDTLVEGIVARWPGIAYVEDSRTSRTLATSDATTRALGCSPDLLAKATADVWRALRHSDDRSIEEGPFRLRLSDASFQRFVDERYVLASDAGGPTLILHTLRPSGDGAA